MSVTQTTTSPCVLSSNPLPNPLPDPATFRTRYWAGQNPSLAAAWTGSPFSQSQAQELVAQGLVIDGVIMLQEYFLDPLTAMILRVNAGYTWVPNASQPNVALINSDGTPTGYDPKNPPLGAIAVSCNLADYPAAVKPVPPPPPAQSLVGQSTGAFYNGLPIYNVTPGTDNSAIPVGGLYTADPRGEFMKVSVMTMLGIPQIFWALLPPA